MRKHCASSWLLSVFIVMSATACGDAGTAPASIAGRYNIVTANGVGLPAIVAELSADEIQGDGLAKVYLNSGHIQINDSGTCSSSVNRTFTTIDDYVIDTADYTDICTWTQAGSTISFTHADGVFWRSDGSSDTATLSGNRLTMTFPNWFTAGTLTFVFER